MITNDAELIKAFAKDMFDSATAIGKLNEQKNERGFPIISFSPLDVERILKMWATQLAAVRIGI